MSSPRTGIPRFLSKSKQGHQNMLVSHLRPLTASDRIACPALHSHGSNKIADSNNGVDSTLSPLSGPKISCNHRSHTTLPLLNPADMVNCTERTRPSQLRHTLRHSRTHTCHASAMPAIAPFLINPISNPADSQHWQTAHHIKAEKNWHSTSCRSVPINLVKNSAVARFVQHWLQVRSCRNRPTLLKRPVRSMLGKKP